MTLLGNGGLHNFCTTISLPKLYLVSYRRIQDFTIGNRDSNRARSSQFTRIQYKRVALPNGTCHSTLSTLWASEGLPVSQCKVNSSAYGLLSNMKQPDNLGTTMNATPMSHMIFVHSFRKLMGDREVG